MMDSKDPSAASIVVLCFPYPEKQNKTKMKTNAQFLFSQGTGLLKKKIHPQRFWSLDRHHLHGVWTAL